LFWAVDAYKAVQERSDPIAPPLPQLKGDLPGAAKAAAEFHDAMQRGDTDRSELALVALARNRGPRQVMNELWPYACCNGSNGGHRAIAAANACRAVDTIGWQHSEPVLRFVVREWQGAKPDGSYEVNVALAQKHLAGLPEPWAGIKGDSAATLELFTVI